MAADDNTAGSEHKRGQYVPSPTFESSWSSATRSHQSLVEEEQQAERDQRRA